jgi:hypothetical protein
MGLKGLAGCGRSFVAELHINKIIECTLAGAYQLSIPGFYKIKVYNPINSLL